MTGERVLRSIVGLPERFHPNGSGAVLGRFRLCIDDVDRDVVVGREACRVEPTTGRADVEIATDADTWLAIDAGALNGIEAFADHRLVVRGSIEKALGFEVMFERPTDGRGYELESVSLGGVHLSVLSMGQRDAQPVVLLHGLGATKASWLPVVPALARDHRVIAVDLPGFGASSKPRGAYDAPFFADHVFRLMDVLGHRRAIVAGNSLGGRVALEMGMLEPERIDALACLCPAAAWTKRPWLHVIRALRPELGVVASRLPRPQVRAALRRLFAEPDRIPDVWYEAAIDDFLQTWKSGRARAAFFKAARNVYLDEPDGDDGFWNRLGLMETPALFVYGEEDPLITHRFARRIERFLPAARVEVWKDCGHVPQLEFTERTTATMLDFFATALQPSNA